MQVSKQVLVAAGAVFLALFGTVFFLLGRESNRRRAPQPVAPVAAVDTWGNAPAPSAAVIAATTAPTATIASAPSPSAPAMPTTAPPPAMPTTARAAPSEPPMTLGFAHAEQAAPPSPSEASGAAVRDYFTRMQAIQTVGPTGDTGEFANKILASSMNGDTSGLDELVRVAEEGAKRAAAVTPPAELAGYHQKMLAMLGESAGMVRQIKTALASNDATALGALAGMGSSLQNRATALEAEARQIKAKYGLR